MWGRARDGRLLRKIADRGRRGRDRGDRERTRGNARASERRNRRRAPPPRVALLDADGALDAHAEFGDAFGARLGLARVEAHAAIDPGTLVAYRAAGYRTIALHAREAHPWLASLARARALELRLFVVVFEPERAYAVDPDGTIVAGTFDDFRIASTAFDLARTEQTAVAPSTDILDGLARVSAALGNGSAR